MYPVLGKSMVQVAKDGPIRKGMVHLAALYSKQGRAGRSYHTYYQ